MPTDMLKKIEYLMAKKGVTSKADLAKQADIPYTTVIGLWEKGVDNTKRSTLLKLSKFFGVTLDYLANDDRNENEGFGVDDLVELFHKNEKIAILFSRSAKLKPQDLDIVLKMVERMDEEDENEP